MRRGQNAGKDSDDGAATIGTARMLMRSGTGFMVVAVQTRGEKVGWIGVDSVNMACRGIDSLVPCFRFYAKLLRSPSLTKAVCSRRRGGDRRLISMERDVARLQVAAVAAKM